jgi:hypothetical protein
MADRLSAALLAAYARPVLRKKVVREAYILNDAAGPTDITARVKSWGTVDFEVFNQHPDERGSLKFPVVSLTVDNSDGYFNRGGAIFPNGNADFESTVVHVSILVGGNSLFVFDGRILQPEYSEGGSLELVAEHPLTAMTSRKWTRDDRIGGDTGIDGYFAS